MDNRQTLDSLGFMDEGIDPAPDMSTYQKMVAGWRHSRTAPSEADMQTAWDVIVATPAPVDPDDALDDAITASNNFGELKAALLGRTRGRK